MRLCQRPERFAHTNGLAPSASLHGNFPEENRTRVLLPESFAWDTPPRLAPSVLQSGVSSLHSVILVHSIKQTTKSQGKTHETVMFIEKRIVYNRYVIYLRRKGGENDVAR